MSKKIATALHAVMSKVSYVQKQNKNDFHGYSYASEADLLEKLRPAMIEEGLMLIPSVQAVSDIDANGNTMVFMEYTLIHKDGEVWPEKIKAAGAGNDRNKNGVGDKGLYKALTGANKYLLFKLFQIETGDDPENDAAQQAALQKSIDTYVEVALQAIGLQVTEDDLNEWWKAETANRTKLGIVKGTPAYDVLTSIAAQKKTTFKKGK